MTIDRKDLETLEKISQDLPRKLISRIAGAQEKFNESATFGEKVGLTVAKLRYAFTSSANPQAKAKRLVAYCDKTVPVLTRAFGEQSVVDALPAEARSEQIAALSENLGGARIARLLRKAL